MTKAELDELELHFPNLIGKSAKILVIKKLILKVAPSNANVLILGASGTGKEVVAKSIHKLSTRHNKNFVPINCGAIPKELLESELFGHEKGAFTGALATRKGRFEMAEKGTMFLDEIGDMPLEMQIKILRILQEKQYERVGSNQTLDTDVRIIAATHRSLEQRVQTNQFREDLYYRLNVFPIELPSLKERAEDIPLLIEHMLDKIENAPYFSKKVISHLQKYAWPGNIRELHNFIQRMAILKDNEEVKLKDLSEKYRFQVNTVSTQKNQQQNINLNDYLLKVEINYITKAIQNNQNSLDKAANSLGISITELKGKIKNYNLKF